MEEVWKDMSLGDQDLSVTTTTTRCPHHHHHPSSDFILQDFLAGPIAHEPSPPTSAPFFGGSSQSQLPPPATVLSLNSGAAAFDFLDAIVPDPLRPSAPTHLQRHPNPDVSSSLNDDDGPFAGIDSSSVLPSFGKKRVPDSDGCSGDRRHKRMIKNRESAARSRARKQAYTNELELEVAHLLKENARLKRQQEELCLAAASQLPKKHTLYRTSTAPF